MITRAPFKVKLYSRYLLVLLIITLDVEVVVLQIMHQRKLDCSSYCKVHDLTRQQ